MVSANRTKSAAECKSQAHIKFEATKLSAAQRNIHIYAQIASISNFIFLVSDMLFIEGQKER